MSSARRCASGRSPTTAMSPSATRSSIDSVATATTHSRYEGANEIQKLVIARHTAKEAAAREPLFAACMPGAEDIEHGQGAGDGRQSEPEAVGALAFAAQSASACAMARLALRLQARPMWLPVTSTQFA